MNLYKPQLGLHYSSRPTTVPSYLCEHCSSSLRLPHGRLHYRTIQNKTDDPNVVVVVTARNVSDQDSDQDKLVAWKILVTQTSVSFKYPKVTGVGAFFMRDEDVITSGPFPAEPGSHWKITQENMKGAPTLEEGSYECCVWNFHSYLSKIIPDSADFSDS